jgi:hypothetical protein
MAAIHKRLWGKFAWSEEIFLDIDAAILWN